MDEIINILKDSLQTGFIDRNYDSDSLYHPELLVNKRDNPKKKVLTAILEELLNCDEFFISVAFVTSSGVASIINTLEILQERNIKGKILVSQYLNFTQPEALKRLMAFDNIDLRIAVNVNAHSKGYLFKRGEVYNLIIGSSNLTQSALSTNKEWNLKVSAINQSKIITNVYNEFKQDFDVAKIVTKSYIEEYKKIYESKKLIISNSKIGDLKKEIKPNSMQTKALENLRLLREQNQNKALIISATGTGKTYLSAFDVKAVNPDKLLFVVHRLSIAKKAMETFKSLFGNSKTMGIYSGNLKEVENDFLFSTIQTISKEKHLKEFTKDYFDYIIIDESHRAASNSYIELIEYFKPKFLLGMTATPERTDGLDIFKLYNYNIAYEIRLHNAMDEDMLSPFHYYGVSDLKINYEEENDFKVFNNLTSEERVSKIIEKSKFYGTDNGVCRGLVFVSKIEEAIELSKKFNERGFKTVALSGNNSNQERLNAIDLLESENQSEKLDYIFSVDIFNEGIDIPSVNQIIMLRPTESAIIFVQQLGRGLRKFPSKSYLTVIDFIGNHKNNYLIPIALYGDTSFNKDKLRKLLSDGSIDIPGASTINFDRISKEKIFESINNTNMSKLADLKRDYYNLKYKLGRIPMMVDFFENQSRDPWLFILSKKSYFNFVKSVENDLSDLKEKDFKLLEFLQKDINNTKRIEESLLLKNLLKNETFDKSLFFKEIEKKYGYLLDDAIIESLVNNLNYSFSKKSNELEKDIIKYNNEEFTLGEDLKNALSNQVFKDFLEDSINYSIKVFNSSFDINLYNQGLVLYNKYSRKDVCRLLNWSKDISSTVYGYKTQNEITPCFVTYHKADDLEGDINYNDHFISPSVFAWQSRSNRKIDSPEIINLQNSKRILLFIKKDDGDGTDFYYVGDVSIINNSVKQSLTDQDKPIVEFKFNLDIPVRNDIYNYFEVSHQKPLIQENNEDSKNEETIYQLPFYDLYAAAGSFSEMQNSKDFSLISVPSMYSKEGYFAFKVVGESMNKRIPNNSICIFKTPVVGSRNDKILLVEYFNKHDTDMNSHFTVKTYASSKSYDENGWQHNQIILKPNSYDDKYNEIVLTQEDFDENTFNVVGEFVAVL